MPVVIPRKMRKLLLHTCCAPCSTRAIEMLCEEYSVTVFYYNPNIYPEAEYIKRKSEQIKYIDILKLNGKEIDYIDCDYQAKDFYENPLITSLTDEPEGGNRCAVCFEIRLSKTANVAKQNNYDIFATSLTVSPHKNASIINQLGNKIAKQVDIDYLETDFKKQNGYKRSVELSKENNLYRQNYCGCKYSIWW